MPDRTSHTALLIDFGGVLTSDIWSSFGDFCAERGLDPEAAKRLFREDPAALAELRGLETGEVDQESFERRFGELLGTDPEGLIEGLFAGLRPAEPMLAAVPGGARGRRRHRPDLELLGDGPLRPRADRGSSSTRS